MNKVYSKKFHKVYHHYVILFFYFIFVFCICISLYCEYKTGNSWFANNCSNIVCPIFLQASAIFETIKIVGFTSLLVGIVQSNLDKKMIGLKYSDILSLRFPLYNLFSAMHILLTLVCIITSSTGLSESALLSFGGVLIGFIYQWCIFVLLVVSSHQCENMAVYAWKKILQQNDTELLTVLLQLIDTLPKSDSTRYKAHLQCLVYTLDKYIRVEHDDKQLFNLIMCWNRLLNVYSDESKNSVAEDVLRELLHPDLCENNKNISVVSSAYVAQQFLQFEKDNDHNTNNNVFEQLGTRIIGVMDNIEYVNSMQKIHNQTKCDMYDSFCTNVYSITWVYMMIGQETIAPELLNILPNKVDFTYVEKLVEILFKPAHAQKQYYLNTNFAIEIVRKQLLHKVGDK